MSLGILRLFHPRTWRSILHADPVIQGRFRVEAREGGKLRAVREGKNICTLTGREHIAELLGLAAWSPRTLWRDDRVAYIGMGIGAQPEVAEVYSLVAPTAYRAGVFLAPLNAPTTFAASGTGTPRTSVQFIREYGFGELSIGVNVVLTEAGLFTDGDPDADWAFLPAVSTTMAGASARAPMFYKTFEPITKTTGLTMRVVWEVEVA